QSRKNSPRKNVWANSRSATAPRNEFTFLMSSLVPEPAPLRLLIDALKRLPGVGERTARRMAYYLLQHDIQGAEALSQALAGAVHNLQRCTRCNGISEEELCALCTSPQRDASLLCVVETPADQSMI